MTARLDNHEEEISKLHKNIQNLGENIDNIEFGGAADMQFRNLEASLIKKSEVMEKEWQRKYEQAPSQKAARPEGPSPTTELDILVIGGFRQDTPKAQILKVPERITRPKLAQRFECSSWEVFCLYLVSSVCFLRDPTPALARQAVAFLLYPGSFKVNLSGEELNLWSTMQKTRDQKDRARRLMRLAA